MQIRMCERLRPSFDLPVDLAELAIPPLLKPVQTERLKLTCQRLQAALALRHREGQAEDKMQQAVEQLRQMLGNAATVITPAPLRLLQIAQGSTVKILPVEEVLYFEAADKYVRVPTNDKVHLVRTSLRELLPQLDTQRFWQIHRSIVVRSDAINRAVRDESGKLMLRLRGSQERLAVSRMYAHLFKGM